MPCSKEGTPHKVTSIAPVMTGAGVLDREGGPKYGLHDFRHFFASWCINPKDRGGRALSAKEVQNCSGMRRSKLRWIFTATYSRAAMIRPSLTPRRNACSDEKRDMYAT